MNKKHQSYMELCIHLDGRGNVYLRVPTVWDNTRNQWIGFVKTPETKKLLYAEGKDLFELQNNFNKVISDAFQSDIKDEVFSMFKALEYWENLDKLY